MVLLVPKYKIWWRIDSIWIKTKLVIPPPPHFSAFTITRKIAALRQGGSIKCGQAGRPLARPKLFARPGQAEIEDHEQVD